MLNKYGLSRNIPENIKREIRQTCGFGCVCCGLAIASYEHIDPEFNEAKAHDPTKMALLCEGCHSRVTRKFWSKEKIRKARELPYCIESGHCHDAFDVTDNNLNIWIGSNRFVNVWSILSVDNTILLSIEPPEEVGSPFRLSGIFYDDNEKFLFKIVRNEWFGESNNWDIECVGGRITIRTNNKEIALQIKCNPPNGITIEKMNMFFRNTQFYADETKLGIKSYDNSSITMSGREFIATDTNTIAFSAVSQGSHSQLSNNIGAITMKGLRMFGGGSGTLGSLPAPENLPNTLKGKYIKKYWGTIKFHPAKRNKIGINDLCYCGSTQKYKKCCISKRIK